MRMPDRSDYCALFFLVIAALVVGNISASIYHAMAASEPSHIEQAARFHITHDSGAVWYAHQLTAAGEMVMFQDISSKNVVHVHQSTVIIEDNQ